MSAAKKSGLETVCKVIAANYSEQRKRTTVAFFRLSSSSRPCVNKIPHFIRFSLDFMRFPFFLATFAENMRRLAALWKLKASFVSSPFALSLHSNKQKQHVIY